jgi:hypothetical protein
MQRAKSIQQVSTPGVRGHCIPLVSAWRRILQSARHIVALWLLAMVTMGCTPTYDWREIHPAEEPFTVMLPARPAAMTRKINLDGVPVSMRMHGALVQGHSFTGAWLRLDESGTPSERQEKRKQALAAMQTGMVSNIAGKVVKREEVIVQLVNAAGAPVGQVPATRVRASGTARGEPAEMHAIFVGLGDTLYQFVVLGKDAPIEQINTFLDSIRLRAGQAAALAARSRANG